MVNSIVSHCNLQWILRCSDFKIQRASHVISCYFNMGRRSKEFTEVMICIVSVKEILKLLLISDDDHWNSISPRRIHLLRA